jgi:hypothetical protein
VGASHISKTAPSREAVAERADWLVRPSGRPSGLASQSARSATAAREGAVLLMWEAPTHSSQRQPNPFQFTIYLRN